MSKGIVAQVSRMLTKEGALDHHSQLLQNLLNLVYAQDKQIAALKAALVSDRSTLLFLFKDRIFGFPETIIGSNTQEANARVQLARELPMIDWEDKQ